MSPRENSLTIAYRYDEDNGVFAGVTYVQFSHGRWNMPNHSTTKQPPDCPKGYVPVFCKETDSWTQVADPDNKIFRLPKTISYFGLYQYHNPRRQTDIPFLYIIKRPNNITDPTVHKIFNLLAPLSSLDRYISCFSAALMFAVRLNYLNKRIHKLFRKYDRSFQLIKLIKWTTSSHFEPLNYEIVEIIHGIKKLLDIIVIAKYLEIDGKGKRFDAGSFLEFDGLGEMLKNDKNKLELRQKIRKNMHFDEYKDLYKAVNDIHNAFKHDILSERISKQIFIEPTLDVYKFRKSKDNLQDIIHYHIPLRSLIWALNDLFSALLSNRKNNVASNFQLIENKK